MLKKLFARMQWLGRKVSRAINLVLIALTYFLAIGPMSILLRLFRPDLLDTHWQVTPGSAWKARTTPDATLDIYRRQF